MADQANELKLLLEEVERDITPSPSQQARLSRVQAELMERAAELVGGPAVAEGRPRPLLVGSVAKGTHLWPCDLDLFLCYPQETPEEHLEQNGLEIAERLLERPRRLYASHPYLRGEFNGFEVDVVPCYRIEPGQSPQTAVDRTPLHTAHVRERLSLEGARQVRLLKSLCKGLGVYGAESAVGGLSGYLCELLIIGYGDLTGLLQGIAEWRPPVKLECTDGGLVHSTGVRKKPDEAVLWIADPVDRRRNVAAAVSEASLATLILGARELLERPLRQIFFPNARPPLDPQRLARLTTLRTTWVALITLDRPRGVNEVVGPQVLTFLRQLWERLERTGFGPLAVEHHMDEDRLFIAAELERGHLPRTRFHPGPHGWRESTDSFRQRWADNTLGRVHLHRGRLVVQRSREHTDLAGWLQEYLGRISVAQPVKGVLAGSLEVRLWAPGQLPLCPGMGLLTRLLDPGLPWEGRISTA